MKEKIVLIGGGGHCKAVIETIEQEAKYQIAGIVDVKEKMGQKVLGYSVFASDEDIPELRKKYTNFIVTVGYINSLKIRLRAYKLLKEQLAVLPVIIAPSASVSRHADIGEGSVVLAGARVNAGAKVGANCIINTGGIIEHDSVVCDHCHISTGSIVNGGCVVKEGGFLGSNSVLVNNISISENTQIGAGSVVISSITEAGVYVGNPVRRIG